MSSDDDARARDLTPSVGSSTDIAATGSGARKPAHERTAHEERALADWKGIAASAGFQKLLRAKRRFIIPATVFFLLYYFALPYLVGYHPEWMQRKVWGDVNWAYLFALSQFFMAWILAAFYVVVAAGWDRKARAIVEGIGR
ncbi:MAG: DUF485 domain-containing protein [Chthoniobacterales bacterium]